jgi:hypothetical protein
VRKGTGIKKIKKGTIGYNKDSPFNCYIKIQYSTSPGKSAARKTKYIEFTADHTADKIGTITPVIKNNTIKVGEVDVVSILKTVDPADNYYWRNLTLMWSSAGSDDVYDPKTEKDTYKMIFYGAGWREGEVTSPEVLSACGQKISDQIYNCQDKLKLDMYMQYAQDRCNDKLMIRRENAEATIIEFREDTNVKEISNINYMPISNLKNSIVKVYKTSDTKNAFVTSKNADSIFRWREHMDMEVLDDNCGTDYAKYQARIDEDRNNKLVYSYTEKIKGYFPVTIGESVYARS